MCYLCIGRKQVKSKQFLLSSLLLRETSLPFRVGETVFDFEHHASEGMNGGYLVLSHSFSLG